MLYVPAAPDDPWEVKLDVGVAARSGLEANGGP
jgi:hypothetical protein